MDGVLVTKVHVQMSRCVHVDDVKNIIQDPIFETIQEATPEDESEDDY